MKSFRLSTRLTALLSKTSLRLKVTETQYVSNVLEKLLTMEPLFQNMGVMALNQRLFQRIIALADREGIEILASEIAAEEIPVVFELLGFEWSQSSLERFMKEVLEPWGWFRMEIVETGLHRDLKLFHKFGSKWSTFLAYYLMSAFQSITRQHPDISIVGNVVKLSYDLEVSSISDDTVYLKAAGMHLSVS